MFLLRGAILLAGLVLRPVGASAAPILLGDSVDGALSSSGAVVAPFLPSSAVVGAGMEFVGVVREPGKVGRLWTVTVDIGESGFSIGWTTPFDEAFVSGGGAIVGLSLTGLDFTPGGIISGVTRTGYTCAASPVVCSIGPINPVLTFTDNSVYVGFGTLRANEKYTFAFNVTESTAAPVPEPTSIALLGGGLATLIARRYRRRPSGGAPSLGGSARSAD